jgi:hypothetical protein
MRQWNVLATIVALAALAGARHLDPTERAALERASRSAPPALLGARAGAVPDAIARTDASERAALRAAEARAEGLGEQRAGDLFLSNRDLTIVLVTIGAVILAILLL